MKRAIAALALAALSAACATPAPNAHPPICQRERGGEIIYYPPNIPVNQPGTPVPCPFTKDAK